MSIITSMTQQDINDRIASNHTKHKRFRAAAIVTIIASPLAVLVSLSLIVLHFVAGGEFLEVALLVKAVVPLIVGAFVSIVAFIVTFLTSTK